MAIRRFVSPVSQGGAATNLPYSSPAPLPGPESLSRILQPKPISVKVMMSQELGAPSAASYPWSETWIKAAR